MANLYDFQKQPAEDAAEYLSSLPKNKESRKKPKNSWRAVFVIALIILILSLAVLAVIAFSYFQGQQKYSSFAEHAKVGDAAQIPLGDMTVDWEELLAINPDTVAWVYVPGTNINYPVVRGSDNEYYLNHDFEGDQGWLANFGAIFMDYRNLPNWSDEAYFMYGHHMNDGSMFADIAGMTDQSKFDNSRIVYLLSPYGNFKLRSYSLIHCQADDTLVQITFADPAEMSEYVQKTMDLSVVEAEGVPSPSNIKKIFAFSTCDNISQGRYVLYTYIEETTVSRLNNPESNTISQRGNSTINDLGASNQ